MNYLGDGDSSSYKTVADLKPYGDDCQVKKLECVGHVQKRVGSRLRKLKKSYKNTKLSDGKTIGGMGRLTDAKIDCLQNYYGLAIRQNTGSVVEMQKQIMASLYHVASTDEELNHHMCPSGDDSWCRYATDTNFKHKHGLPESVLELVEPIYDALSTPELLGKCLHGKTQNNNECLNKLIWDRCTKKQFVSSLVIEDAVCSAVSYFNDGNISVQKLFGELCIPIGHFTAAQLAADDRSRLYFARRKSLDPIKKQRKILRAKKKHTQDVRKVLPTPRVHSIKVFALRNMLETC